MTLALSHANQREIGLQKWPEELAGTQDNGVEEQYGPRLLGEEK